MKEPESIPLALIEPARRRSWAWLLPMAALVLAGFLVAQSWGARGTLVTVRAAQGHGVKPGDSLRYRGIEVGRVEEVGLGADLTDVRLAVRLEPASAGLARAGSRFWIVRPQLALDSVQGLETVIGARYLAVLPGPPGARRQVEFLALEEPPVPEAIEPGGLEIALESARRFGLAPGAELSYRGIQIGSVLSVGLSNDATFVEIRAYVRPAYVALIRPGSVFWESGGFELEASLTGGVSLDVGTLRSLIVGGIEVATPTTAGEPVSTGHRFELHDAPRKEWLAWRPAVAIGAELVPKGSELPRLVRAQLTWNEGRSLRSLRLRERSLGRSGWVFRGLGGIVGPADLLAPADGAIESSSTLALGGQVLELDGLTLAESGGLALLEVDVEALESLGAPVHRALEDPEDCLVFGDPSRGPRALSATHLTAEAPGWRVDDALGFDSEWHGGAVVARADGALLGLLLVTESGARVASLAPLFAGR